MPESPAAFRRKTERWKHYSFFGYCRMMEMQLRAIIDARSTTTEATQQAQRILLEVEQLRNLLQKRIDHA